MKEMLDHFHTGIFPNTSESQFLLEFEKTMGEICSSIKYGCVKCHFAPNYENYSKDFNNILSIRELNLERYNFYLEKLIKNYTTDVDNIELRVYPEVYSPAFGFYSETVIIMKLLPEKQAAQLTIRKNTTLGFFTKPLYLKEFSEDTPISTIKESIDNFYRKRNYKKTLDELDQKYK